MIQVLSGNGKLRYKFTLRAEIMVFKEPDKIEYKGIQVYQVFMELLSHEIRSNPKQKARCESKQRITIIQNPNHLSQQATRNRSHPEARKKGKKERKKAKKKKKNED